MRYFGKPSSCMKRYYKIPVCGKNRSWKIWVGKNFGNRYIKTSKNILQKFILLIMHQNAKFYAG